MACPIKISDQSETSQDSYEEASRTRKSFWLRNESHAPEAGLEPGSDSGTLVESYLNRVRRAHWMPRAGHCSHASVNASHTGEISPGKNKCTSVRFVDLTMTMCDFVRGAVFSCLPERNTYDPPAPPKFVFYFPGCTAISHFPHGDISSCMAFLYRLLLSFKYHLNPQKCTAGILIIIKISTH